MAQHTEAGVEIKEDVDTGALLLAVLSVLGLALFFLTWHFVIAAGIVPERLLAAPTTIISTFLEKLTDASPDGYTLQENFLVSLKLALVGYLSALAIGTPLGLLMGWYRVFDRLITPIFEIVRPIPPIAWIPISIIWLGVGLTAKAFIIFLSAFVSCVINSYTGVKMANPVLINVARTCGASRWEIFTTVCIPSAIPMVFSGFRIALGNAWSTLVAAELLASTGGLGFMIQMGRTLARPDIIIVGMLTIGCSGAIMTGILGLIEKQMAPWRNRR